MPDAAALCLRLEVRGMSAGIGPELLNHFPGPAAEKGNADRGNACQTDDEKHCQNHSKDRHNDTSFLSMGISCILIISKILQKVKRVNIIVAISISFRKNLWYTGNGSETGIGGTAYGKDQR